MDSHGWSGASRAFGSAWAEAPELVHAFAGLSTALGALSRHVSESDPEHYGPMNVTFGLIDDSALPPIRDRAKRREEIVRLWEPCRRQWERNAQRERYDPELIRFRWLLEELRVSQFAQELKTLLPVSVKRLEEQWGKVRQG